MSGGELIHRVRERLHIRALARERPSGRGDQPRPQHMRFCSSPYAQLPQLDWDRAAVRAIAPELVAGRWHALAFDWHWSNAADCWRVAPDTGAAWPQQPFARIQYRTGNPYGDARVVWEPARLQQLVSLA